MPALLHSRLQQNCCRQDLRIHIDDCAVPAAQASGYFATGIMPLSLCCALQNGEEVRFEELSDAVHFEAHHVRLHQVAIITGKLPRLLLDEVFRPKTAVC